MSRRQKDPLRPLTDEEQAILEEVSHSRSLPWVQVSRAKALLAVSEGKTFTQAAHSVGYKLGDSVADWVSRFNRDGLSALEPKHGGDLFVSIPTQKNSVFWPRCNGHRKEIKMAPPRGHWKPSKGLCVRRRMGCLM